jgi:hypothetical protein
VVAIVSLDEAAPWWLRLLAEEALVVFDALPALAADGPPFALAVARTSLEPSGADRTFFVADTPLSAAEVEARLGEAGLAGELLRQAGGVKLFALAGFVAPGDERLMRVPGRLLGVVGAAPLPFDL